MDGLWVPSDAIHHFHLVYCGGRLSGMMEWCGGNVARWLCTIKVNGARSMSTEYSVLGLKWIVFDSIVCICWYVHVYIDSGICPNLFYPYVCKSFEKLI